MEEREAVSEKAESEEQHEHESDAESAWSDEGDREWMRHPFEAASRVVRESLRGSEVTKLRSAFLTCADPLGDCDLDGLEVWCAMAGVRCTSELDSRARIVPLLRGAATLRRARGVKKQEEVMSFAELEELIFGDEQVELTLAAARATFGDNSEEALKSLCGTRSHCSRRRAVAALLGRTVRASDSFEERKLGGFGSLLVAERLDVNGDGLIDAEDLAAFLSPPRDAGELRAALTEWCTEEHSSKPRLTFDALDVEGRGLVTRADLAGAALDWTRAEVDVAFGSLDGDGSGCVDLAEFKAWLREEEGAELSFSDSEEPAAPEDAPLLCPTTAKREKTFSFSAAAAQVRAALLERCGDGEQAVRDRLSAEFAKIDTDASGGISAEELRLLVTSIGIQITDGDEARDVGPAESTMVAVFTGAFEQLGLTLSEVVTTQRARALVVTAVKQAAAEQGVKVGDEVVAVCGKKLTAILDEMPEESFEVHFADALTRAAAEVYKAGPIKALTFKRRSAHSISEAQLAALLRAIDADSSGTISLEEIAAFILDVSVDGEAELGLVVEALREEASRLGAADGLPPSTAAFGHIAVTHTAKKQAAHALPTAAIVKWARSLQKLETAHGKVSVSRRQGALIAERIDANADGVVSRSEFEGWLFPKRPIEVLLKGLNGLVDSKGTVATLFAMLTDKSLLTRLEASKNFQRIGFPLSSAELQELLVDDNKREGLSLSALCIKLGRPVEKQIVIEKQVKASKKKLAQPSRPPVKAKAKVKEAAAPSPLKAKKMPSFATSSTPEELKRIRQAAARRSKVEIEATGTKVNDEEDPLPTAAASGLATLQALGRSRRVRTLHESMRREASLTLALEASLLREAGLKAEIASTDSKRDQELAAQREESQKALEALQRKYQRLENASKAAARSADSVRRELQSRLEKLTATHSDSLLDERRKAASHYRTKLATQKSTPASPNNKRPTERGMSFSRSSKDAPPPPPPPLQKTTTKRRSSTAARPAPSPIVDSTKMRLEEPPIVKREIEVDSDPLNTNVNISLDSPKRREEKKSMLLDPDPLNRNLGGGTPLSPGPMVV